jgi:hypothetical protein
MSQSGIRNFTLTSPYPMVLFFFSEKPTYLSRVCLRVLFHFEVPDEVKLCHIHVARNRVLGPTTEIRIPLDNA